MPDSTNNVILVDQEQITAIATPTTALKQESLELLTQIIAEKDIEKTKDLTQLFNQNQAKKTMVRNNKLNELMDIMTDQAIARFSTKPDNISNQELIQGMKVIQDVIEKGQRQINDSDQQPLIQINQQNNEVNVGNGITGNLNRESRDKVKNAVSSILDGLLKPTTEISNDVVEVTVEQDNTISEEGQ